MTQGWVYHKSIVIGGVWLSGIIVYISKVNIPWTVQIIVIVLIVMFNQTIDDKTTKIVDKVFNWSVRFEFQFVIEWEY